MKIVGMDALLLTCVLLGGGCRHVTDPEAVHVGTPTATETAQAIVDRYRNDAELADELFKGKLVHIKKFRVDKIGSRYLRMNEDGYELRLDIPSDTAKIHKNDTIKLFCEGKGLREEKQIVFKDCYGRLD